MRSLGADFTVDYKDPQWQEHVKQWRPDGVDAALAIQPGTGMTSLDVVKDSGVVVPVSDYQLSGVRHISIRPLDHKVDVKQELTTMMTQISRHDIQLTIEKVYPFANALDALQKTTTRHARGKVVIDLEKMECSF